LEEAVESALRVDVELRVVYRESDDGQSERLAESYERQVSMALGGAGESQRWMERRFVVPSLCHAKASEAALRARVAKAQVEALNQRGRGRKRFEDMDDLRQAVSRLGLPGSMRAIPIAKRRGPQQITCSKRLKTLR